MQTERANYYLDKWAVRMRPANAPFDRNETARNEWVDALTNATTTAANAAWAEWQHTGATRWPNLYQMQVLLRKHAEREALAECPACLGHGWIEHDDLHHNGHTYSTVAPCTCPHGTIARSSTIWREANA